MIEDDSYETAIQAMTEINGAHPAANVDEHSPSSAFRIDRKLGHEIVRSLDLADHLEDIVAPVPPTKRRKRPRLSLDGPHRSSRNTIKSRLREIEAAITEAIRGQSAPHPLSPAEAKACVKLFAKSRMLAALVGEIGAEVVHENGKLRKELREAKAVMAEQRKYLKKQAPGGVIYQRRAKRHADAMEKLKSGQAEEAKKMRLRHEEVVEKLEAKMRKAEAAAAQKIEEMRKRMFDAGVGRSVCKVDRCSRFSRGKSGTCYRHASASAKD